MDSAISFLLYSTTCANTESAPRLFFENNLKVEMWWLGLGLAVLLTTALGKGPPPPSAISKFYPGGQYVMLTFDDSPHFLSTPKVLDILKTKGIKATFFILGSKSLFHAEIVKRIHKEGHQVANNGWKRHIITDDSFPAIESQVQHTTRALYNLTHVNTTFYRPYNGMSNEDLNKQFKTNNMQVILWNQQPTENAKDILSMADKIAPGDIVRMQNTKTTIEALPHFIDKLTQEGYEFLTIAQVASFPDDSPH